MPSVLCGPATIEERLFRQSVLTKDAPDVESATAIPTLSVNEFLQEADVEKYSRLFAARQIDTMEKLLRLTDDDLKEMGVTLMGPRRKLTSAIAWRQKRKMIWK